MNKINIKTIFSAIVILLAITVFASSCSPKYGCGYNVQAKAYEKK